MLCALEGEMSGISRPAHNKHRQKHPKAVAADSPMPRTTDNGKSDMEPVTSKNTVQLSQPLSGSPPKSPDIYLGFSVLALGGPDVETVCSRQFAVQSASDARQPFEYSAYGISSPWLSGGSWLMLHAINT